MKSNVSGDSNQERKKERATASACRAERPPGVYRLATDGRKWRAQCDTRRSLVLQLATYANPDGGSIKVSAETLAASLGKKRSVIFELLKDLKKLGFLDDGELTTFHTRGRSLNVKAILAAANRPGFADNRPGFISDTTVFLTEDLNHKPKTLNMGALCAPPTGEELFPPEDQSHGSPLPTKNFDSLTEWLIEANIGFNPQSKQDCGRLRALWAACGGNEALCLGYLEDALAHSDDLEAVFSIAIVNARKLCPEIRREIIKAPPQPMEWITVGIINQNAQAIPAVYPEIIMPAPPCWQCKGQGFVYADEDHPPGGVKDCACKKERSA